MFHGAMVALITPFQDGEIDFETLDELIEFQLENGIDAIVPVGTTGESPTLSHAEHKKVKQLAENIVSSQEAEIEELKDIKREEFGASRVPMDMSQTGGMMADPQALADEKPFDDAFIEAMIPHHESAIGMAEVAREKSDNPRVEELAGKIIRAQEREISQMRSWHDDWYPRG